MRIEARLATALMAAAISWVGGCEPSPVEVEPVEVPTVNRTALFDDVQVELTKVNYSWMPPEGPIPEPDVHLMTVEVSVVSFALESRSIRPSGFRLRTWDANLRYDPTNTEIWRPETGGREPAFEATDLENGERLRAWLTFRVPKGLSHLPDALLWTPDPRVAFSFELPTSSGSLVCGETRVFGTVTDLGGSPVEGASVELAYFDLGRPGNAFEGGRCRGEPTVTRGRSTDREGRYEDPTFYRFCDPRCVEIAASAPEGGGLGEVRVTGGTVWPSAAHPLVEPSELRIDAVLPREAP